MIQALRGVHGSSLEFARRFGFGAVRGLSASSAVDPEKQRQRLVKRGLCIPEVKQDGAEVTVVETVAHAKEVVEQLRSLRSAYHACDTEASQLDLKTQSPVGHGRIICFSVYCGPDVNFGSGSRLWVDTLDGEPGVMEAFQPYFEDKDILKVWHNYSFDRHMFYNHGIDVVGFGGDTMHMARLWDPSRGHDASGQFLGYSLEKLTEELVGHRKVPMKERFGVPGLLKNGTPGKTKVIPDLEKLQRDLDVKPMWIDYSTQDAEGTWYLRENLDRLLSEMWWQESHKRTMMDFYMKIWRPFGEILTDIERRGVEVDLEGLQRIEIEARRDINAALKNFHEWASEYTSERGLLNHDSNNHIRQLLFAPWTEPEASFKARCRSAVTKHRSKFMDLMPEEIDPEAQVFTEPTRLHLPAVGVFSIDRDAEVIKQERANLERQRENEHAQMMRDYESDLVRYEGELEEWRSLPKADRKIVPRPRKPTKPKKPSVIRAQRTVELSVKGLGFRPIKTFTKTGFPQVNNATIQRLAGKNPGIFSHEKEDFGDAYKSRALKSTEEKVRACQALFKLIEANTALSLLNSFICPLQVAADSNSRVHTGINLNTETGRLSSKKPNLQNQPAAAKDRYKIRDMFRASEGNKMIVADYGQLELRVLAHMANCKPMIEAFRLGGDFHSRTALDMYSYINEDIQAGNVLLEWDYSKGAPPAPLLKEKYNNERQKAKILNFSIAYGKTAMGLSKDWEVSVSEAQETVERWYAGRPEVKKWQERMIQKARETGNTWTLMGRHRPVPDIRSPNKSLRGHAERVTINTPVQGGAADIVTCAMLQIQRCRELKELGWVMLLQVHDEIILEGPAESADRALELVKFHMANPFERPLRVELVVDAKYDDTWYKAK